MRGTLSTIRAYVRFTFSPTCKYISLGSASAAAASPNLIGSPGSTSELSGSSELTGGSLGSSEDTGGSSVVTLVTGGCSELTGGFSLEGVLKQPASKERPSNNMINFDVLFF